MEENLIKLGIAGLILLGFTFIGDNLTHYCESTQTTMYCARTTAQYCYPSNETRTGSKRCIEGWKEILAEEEDTPQIQQIHTINEGMIQHCDSTGCF